ncbi:MAG: CSLREA domain-containing protein [Chloroflexota bacterium]
MSKRQLLLALLLAATFAVANLSSDNAYAVTLTVNSTDDSDDGACDPKPGGDCTLREALHYLTSNSTVNFNVPTSDPHCTAADVCTFTPTTEYPDVSGDSNFINANSQPGAARNTQDVGENAVVKIQIDDGFVKYGLKVTGDHTQIEGFSIYNIQGAGINKRYAIDLDTAQYTSIFGNYLGITAAGLDGGNSDVSSFGVYAEGGSNVTNMGRADSVGFRNVISGLAVGVSAQDSPYLHVNGNYIGTNPAGVAQIANGTGVEIHLSPDSTIGTGGSVGGRNVIAGNTLGIALEGEVHGADGVTIAGNYIGVKASGAALGNARNIQAAAVDDLQIGGADAGNIISNSTQEGIYISGATNVTIQGNRIGTNPAGTAAMQNATGIYFDQVNGATIGGLSPELGNLISGNLTGIRLDGGTQNVEVAGNGIGTNAAGTAGIGNGRGIDVGDADAITIGGDQNSARNVVSASTGQGLFIHELADGTVLKRNYIGTTITGNAALANTGAGVIDFGTNTLIQLNVISGNSGDGILFQGTNGVIQGNFIGVAQNLTSLGNGTNGIEVMQPGTARIENLPGGPPNIIANNGGDGINVTGTTPFPMVTINRNDILSNGNLGIDLGSSGPSVPDPDDADVGPNGLQNYPQLSYADTTTKIQGTIDSTPNHGFLVEFFEVAACDPSGHGEGALYFGAINLAPDADGNIAFQATSPAHATVGHFITATLTDTTSNATSEFSQCIQVVTPASPTPTATGPTPTGPTPSPTPTSIPVVTPPPSAAQTDAPTPTPTATPSPTPTEPPTPTTSGQSESPTASSTTDSATPGPSGGTVTPTPTETAAPTATPTASPTPTGSASLRKGDVDCDGQVTGRDALVLVTSEAGLPISQFSPCPDLLSRTPMFGDVNCDGAVDIKDGVSILAWLAGIDPKQQPGCIEIGELLPV